MKLVDVDPGPSPNIDKEGANKHNNKRFFRSFALVLGTFAATLGITYYVPNVIFETFAVKVPVWYLLNQEVFVTTICSGAIAYLNCFYHETRGPSFPRVAKVASRVAVRIRAPIRGF